MRVATQTTAGNGGQGGAICANACPIHCAKGTIDLINAHLMVSLRLGALALSAVAFLMFEFANIEYAFRFEGKILPLPCPPEMYWAIIMAPWLCEGVAKLVNRK
jgi:hypothetical protein